MLWVLFRITEALAILMSTHNICFYVPIKKHMFLWRTDENYPSGIIKYTHLFFCKVTHYNKHPFFFMKIGQKMKTW